MYLYANKFKFVSCFFIDLYMKVRDAVAVRRGEDNMLDIIYLCIYMYIYTHTYIHTYIYTYIYIYIYACVYMYIHVHIYVYMCVCLCVYRLHV